MSPQPAPNESLINSMQWQETKRLFHAALEIQGEARGEYLRRECSDCQIIQQVESLLLAHESAGDFILEPALVEAGLAGNGADALPFAVSGVPRQRVGPYEIVKELGRGGMGAVYLAARADAQFKKQVAIKIAKRGMDTEAILRRFVVERQILANLEHENIARFLDGGTTEDGLPYFVMEYVEGQPITKYCDAHSLDTTERLKLFHKACTAVQYAHQNLIVHRDLKPSNILVTADGAPKLLDFGIAKLLNPEWSGEITAETASSLRLMTPEYASPEQLRGLQITTATDVYSLGVVLYELLSGHRPFRFPNRLPEEIIRVVLTQQPTRPSDAVTQPAEPRITDGAGRDDSVIRSSGSQVEKLRRRLAGDLDNIVLKALHKEVARRYASVQEFAEDIRRHLTGLPVNARPDTLAYRAGKFIHRHRAGVATAAAVIVTMLSAVTVTSWQAHVARRERAKSERRFAEQRKLANSLITEVQSSLNGVPYSVPTQRLLAQKSLEYLNNLSRDAADDPEFLGELAAAYRDVGYLQAWSLQDDPDAVLSYNKAIELCRRRVALEPNSILARRGLGDALQNKFESLRIMQRLEEASSTVAEKLTIEQQIMYADPQNADQMMGAAETDEEYGEILHGLKQDDEANAKFREAVVLAAQAINLVKAQATTPERRVDLSLMQEKLASIYEQLNELPQAAQSYREAAAVATEVHTEHPEIVQALRNTTSSHWFLGMVLDRLGDHQGALENFRFSLKTINEALAADPTVDPSRYGEMKYSIVLGKALCKAGKIEEGVPLIRHGIEMAVNYQRSDKGNAESSFYGAELLGWSVEGLSAAGLTDEARTVCLEAIEWVKKPAENSPENPNPKLHLASLYELLGDVEARYDSDSKKIMTSDRARLEQARSAYQKALSILEDATSNFGVSPASTQDQINGLRQKIAESEPHPGRQG